MHKTKGRISEKSDERKELTVLSSLSTITVMPTTHDVWSTLNQRLMRQRERTIELRAEREKRRRAYEEYRDYSRELEDRTNSMKRIAGLIGERDESIQEMVQEELSSNLTANQLRKQLALWEAIYEYLTCVDEAQVVDIHTFLSDVGIRTSRAAIDSALKTHSGLFRTILKGRQKWVTLKKGGL